MAPPIVLRDVQVPPAPPWWPPAPGWWALALVLAGLALVAWWRIRRVRRRRRELQALFDAALARASGPAARLAVASEFLRRAARQRDAGADRLHGGDWLAFLDAGAGTFLEGDGRLLLDGPFQPEVDPQAAARATALARSRFVDLMERR